MKETLKTLYDVIQGRKQSPSEGSYTCYLFEQGLDKILKKVAEETGEVIIAAKNGEIEPLCGEVCDLLYHLMVLLAETGLPLEQVMAELDARSQKIGNLKQMKKVDRNPSVGCEKEPTGSFLFCIFRHFIIVSAYILTISASFSIILIKVSRGAAMPAA